MGKGVQRRAPRLAGRCPPDYGATGGREPLASDRMAAPFRVAEVVRRNQLLGERREIAGPFGLAEIDEDSAILPDVVVIVVVVDTVIDE